MDESDKTEPENTVTDEGVFEELPDEGAEDLRERRLHIKAYDFWLSLKDDDDYPRFADLKPDGLDSFKGNSLLLDIRTPGKYVVRFIGDRVATLVDAPVERFSDLGAFPESGFARELVAQLDAEAGNYRAAEFEFEEDRILSRGIFLPFYGVRDAVQFLLVVTNFKRVEDEVFNLDTLVEAGVVEVEEVGLSDDEPVPATDVEAEAFARGLVEPQSEVAPERPEANVPETPVPEAAVLDSDVPETPDPDAPEPDAPEQGDTAGTFGKMVDAVRSDVPKLSRPDAASRTDLYGMLAKAMTLFEEASRDPDAFRALLMQEGLKMQARAPFTPVLKLVFGKNYDKTRLTEYASALSYAHFKGVKAVDVADFLQSFSGGIKGCVKAERIRRRQASGHRAHDRQAEAVEAVRAMPAKNLKDLGLSREFSMVIVRSTEHGQEIVAEADVSDVTIDAALRRLKKKNKP